MICCLNCFNSDNLKKYIKEEGFIDNCDFCISKNVNCIKVEDLYDMFCPLIELYREAEYGVNFFGDDTPLGDNLPYRINHDWEIFSDIFNYDKVNDFWVELVNYNHKSKDFDPINLYGFWVENEELDYLIENLWKDLSNHLKRERRFIVSNERIENILSRLPLVLERTYKEIPVGKKFYRARLGPYNVAQTGKAFTCKKMGMPLPEETSEGRANPVGIPFLYLASNTYTAISEVRPWKGAYVSVGTFESKEEIKVIDLTGSFYIHDPFGISE